MAVANVAVVVVDVADVVVDVADVIVDVAVVIVNVAVVVVVAVAVVVVTVAVVAVVTVVVGHALLPSSEQRKKSSQRVSVKAQPHVLKLGDAIVLPPSSRQESTLPVNKYLPSRPAVRVSKVDGLKLFNLLLSTRNSRSGNVPIVEGTWPEKKLSCNSKNSRRLQFPISDGIVPCILFCCRFLRDSVCVGGSACGNRIPYKLHSDRSKSVASQGDASNVPT